MSPRVGSAAHKAIQRLRSRMVSLFVGVFVVLVAAAVGYWSMQRALLRDEVARDLEAILRSKVRQISGWRLEHMEQARDLARAAFAGRDLRLLLTAADSPEAQVHVAALRAQFNASQRFSAVLLVDRTERVCLSLREGPATLAPSLAASVRATFATGLPRIAELDSATIAGNPGFDVVLPMREPVGATQGEVQAVLVLRLNARHFLLPLADDWPQRNRSGEFQLVMPLGDEVLFLTAPRAQPGALATMRFPLSAEIASTRAARGERGVIESWDYRGRRVLAAVGSVPDSPWLLVAKVETDEAYEVVREFTWLVAGVATLLVAALGGFAAYYWRLRREQLSRDAAQELRRANRLYATLARANQAALQAHSREELAERVCAALVEEAGMRLAWIGWEQPAERRLQIEAVFGPAQGYVEGLVISTDPMSETARGPSGRAVASDVPQVCQDIETDPAMALWRDKQRHWGIRSSAAVPVRDADGTRGSITLYSDEPGFFSEAIIGLVQQMAAAFTHALKALTARQLLERQAVALRESEARYRTLFEDNHAAVLLVDPAQGRIVDANEAACRFYGYDHASLCKLSVTDLNTMSPEQLRAHIAERVQQGRSATYHFEHRLADGSVRAVEVVSGPMQIDGRRLLYSIVHDETDRVRAERQLRESEQRWQFALEGADEGVWDWNMKTDEVYFSPRLITMLGYNVGEFRPHLSEWETRVHPDDAASVRAVLGDYLEGRQPRYVSEHRLRHKDGSYLWIRDLGMVMERDAAGKPLRMIGTHTDITERKRAEQSLRESEARLRQLFDHLEAGVVVHGPNGEVVLANLRACEILGLSLAELQSRHLPDWERRFKREDGTAMTLDELPVSRVLASRVPVSNLVMGVARPGADDVSWGLVNAYPEYAADGQVTQVVVLILDITERKRQERQIVERESRWQETLLTAMDGYVELDTEGRILEVNPAYARISGYSAAELLNLRVWDIEVDYDPAAVAQVTDELRRTGSRSFRTRHRRKDGAIRHVDVSITYSSRMGGRLSCFIRDVTEQQKANEQLLVQSAALESAANTIVITDATGRIEWVNDAFTRATGYTREEAVGNNPRVLKSGRHDAQFYAQMWQTISSGQVWQGELHNLRKDGSPLEEEAIITPVRASGGAITHYVAIKQDVTERKHLEAQLLRSQRMEGIGMLAGGIAHDLNNVLAPILLSVELLRLRFKEPADRRTLEVIESSARRGAGIVKQVLTFARGIDGDRIPIRPRDLVREIVMMIEETFPREISIRREVPTDTPLVSGDVTQLHQVLLNLAVNARDAMPGGGTLTFHVEVLELAADTNVYSGDLKAGTYVVLAVEDTGQGMPPEVREHIFEPFFTTKARGKGTGLGLPTVLGIVRSHGGAIDVRSEIGRGSEFRIFLPAIAAEHGEAPAEAEVPKLAGAGRTVLVVDDEPAIREVASLVLQQSGFQILEASNGREAVEMFNRNRGRIDAVLTDIMMPLMTGDRAAAEILQQQPNLPILFMSGLMEQDAVQAALRNVPGHKVTLIRKPFVASDLLVQIGRVLDAAKT